MGALAAPAAAAAAFWFLRHDGTWDTYRMPLFWPFLFTAGLVTVFSTSEMADDVRTWRALIAWVAGGAACVVILVAGLASTNPINGLHARDVVILAVLAAALAIGGGASSAIARRAGALSWQPTAWCLVACLLEMWLIPRALLLLPR